MARMIFILLFVLTTRAECEHYTCFSMSKAQALSALSGSTFEAFHLGGITRLVGIVCDSTTGDLIIVGYRDANYPEITLDDFVVALRIVFLYPKVQYPGLSIDPDKNNPDSRFQIVRYIGGIENTRFGLVCFAADTLLKKMSLGIIPTGAQEVISPWDLQRMTNPSDQDTVNGGSRTYFYPIAFNSLVIQNAAYLQINRIVVLSEGVSSSRPDPAENYFAQQLTKHFEEAACTYPLLEDLRNLMSAYALAKSILKMNPTPDLNYWLKEYKLKPVNTPLQVKSITRGIRGLATSYIASGKIELRTQVELFEAGDPIALSEIVLASRPPDHPLTWSFEVLGDSLIFSQTAKESMIHETMSYGDYYLEKREYPTAVESFTRAINLGLISTHILCQRAFALNALQQTDRALADCNHALQLDSTDPNAWLTRAQVFIKLSEVDRAKKDIFQALKLASGRLESQLIAANLLYQLRQHELALQLVGRVLVSHPHDGQARFVQGEILAELGRYEDAVKTFVEVSQSGAKPELVRTAYHRSEAIRQKHKLRSQFHLPNEFSGKKSHFFDLTFGLYPGYVFGQVYSPPELRKLGYIDYVSMPLVSSGSLVLSNWLRLYVTTSFDFELRRIWTQKSKVATPDSLYLTFLDNVHGIVGRLGYSQIGCDWLILNGFWNRPFLIFSISAFVYPYSTALFKLYPLKKSNYLVPPGSIATQNSKWHGVSSLQAEIPLADRLWLSTSESYIRSLGLDIEDRINLEVKLRSMLSAAKEGIFINVGANFTKNSVFTEAREPYRQTHFYTSIERSRKNKSEVLNLGVLILDNTQTGQRTRYLFGSLQFSRQLFSKDTWF